MKRSSAFLVVLFLTAVGVGAEASHLPYPREAEYFFLPPRSLFHFRPELFFFGGLFHHPGYPIYTHTRYFAYPRVFHHPRFYHPPFLAGTRPRAAYRLYVESPAYAPLVRANFSDVIFQVTPARALVYINGKLIGSAGDFATPRDRYMLLEGPHQLRIEFPGYEPFEAEMEVVPNRTLRLNIELEARR